MKQVHVPKVLVPGAGAFVWNPRALRSLHAQRRAVSSFWRYGQNQVYSMVPLWSL